MYKHGLYVFDVSFYTSQVYYTKLHKLFFFLSKEIVHILIFQSVIFISGKGIANFYQQKCIFILRLQEKKKSESFSADTLLLWT